MIVGSQIAADVIVRGATSAEAQLIGVGAASDSAASKLAALAIGGAAIATGALIAVGAISLKMAADFQQGVNRLRTGAGDTQDSFASLSKGILQVSTDTGVLTPALTNAMYLILSSGQRGAEAMNTLSVAAKGAQVEQANVVDVSNILSGAMHNFGTSVFSATDYMNGLMTAVSEGKITLQQLAVAMGPIEPLAHQLGISYNDLAAAMTTQTNAMIPADRAATSLRFMMQSLEVPTKKAKDAMAAMGLNSIAVGEELKVSLPGALQLIYDAAKKAGPEGSVPFNRAVSDMIGGQRSLSAFLALTGTHMADFVKNSNDIAASMKRATPEVQGWAIAQGNLNIQVDKAHAALDAVFIKIGTDLLPMAAKFLQTVVVPAIANFEQWSTKTTGLHDAFATLFSVMGGVITDAEAVVSWFGKAGPQGQLLKDVLVGLAGVVGALKFTEMIAGLTTLATVTIPAALTKLGFLVVAEEATGTAAIGSVTQLKLWTGETAAAGTAADIFAGKLAGMKAALSGVGIGMAAFGLSGLFPDAPQIDPTLKAKLLHNAGIQTQQDLQNAAAAQKALNDQINQGWKDMNDLFDEYSKFEGYNPDSHLPYFNSFIVHVDETKAHLDDLGNDLHKWTGNAIDDFNNVVGFAITPLTAAEERARQRVIAMKSTIDDTKFNAIDAFNAMSGSILGTLSPAIERARQRVIDLKSHIDDIKPPVGPTIVTRSVDDAIAKMKNLDFYIRNLPNHQVNINTNYTQTGSPGLAGPLRQYAEGGPVLSTGLALVHKGEYVLPANTAALPGLAVRMGGSGGSPVIHVHPPDIYLDGVRLSRGLLPHLTNAIRYNVSSGFGR